MTAPNSASPRPTAAPTVPKRLTFEKSRLGLHDYSLHRHEDLILLFPWTGTRAQMALVLALVARQIGAVSNGIAVIVPGELESELDAALRTMAREAAPDPIALAHFVPDMKRAKYDAYLGDALLARDYASERIDASRIPTLAAELLARMPPRSLHERGGGRSRMGRAGEAIGAGTSPGEFGSSGSAEAPQPS